ncbi:uncharacterized protein P884DRAFT_210838 [Thermothelomyces heterothallicus CBS 202.75]|uniref:uncharacterized protein n=1 Tax=Thermothelomyces heterothallicus CBS 202.75 TaxID=1149848 RepID=UPI0037427A13
MVGGGRVLLSLAVLAGLGFENALGGQHPPPPDIKEAVVSNHHRRQDEISDTLRGATGAASFSTSSQIEVLSQTQPSSEVAIAATPSEQRGDAAEGVSGALPESSPQTTQGGGLGPEGSLTTEPPPEDTPTSSTSVQPTGVQGGGSSAENPGYTYAPAQSAPSTATAQEGAEPTPPRGGPPRGGPPGSAPKGSTFSPTYATTETIDLGYGTVLPGDTTFTTSTRPQNQTFTVKPSGSIYYCNPSDLDGSPTSWSVVHTTTITWYGDPEDYTPPYPPVSIPGPTSSCVVPVTPPKLTISVCASTGAGTEYRTCEVTTTTQGYGFGLQTSITPSVVFLTTDKNPAVIFTTITRPDYGVSQGAQTRDDHASPTTQAPNSSPAYDSPGGPQGGGSKSAERPTPTPISVAVQPTAVVINGHTIRDNPAQPTQVVIVAGQTFTIDPTRVVGGGATIDRPSATGGIYLPEPTSTNLNGVPVVVSSSVAVIGRSTFTLGPTTTTAVVSGRTFTVGPTTIAGGSHTLPLPAFPSPTEVVVAGGDLITAIGSSVFVVHGTTLTYELTAPESTVITVDDDVVTLGPGGITAHDGDVTLGGTHAAGPQDTQYALVGGATITKIGASVVVIRNTTYTVGPDAAAAGAPGRTAPGHTGTGTTTTVVGGETVTIGPDGVQVGSLTLRYPFGPTTVITPGVGVGPATATATGAGGGGDEDGVGALRPRIAAVVWAVGLAVGIGLTI